MILTIKELACLTRLINIGLRGITLVSKFVLIFFLAVFLEPKELGLYGLITATIAYAIYPLGFDFYAFTTRELLKHDRSKWGGMLKDQGVFHLILYALVMPLLLLIFVLDFLPWYVAGWFFVLLVLEHLNQELMRLLVAISQQLIASVVLFLRSGAWAIAITALMFADENIRQLESVLIAWSIGGMAALFLSSITLFRLKIGDWRSAINWKWLGHGLKIAIPLLVATLAIRGVFTFDRYWFESLHGLELLGVYVLFMGITNSLMSFMDAGVFSFIYPNLIRYYNNNDKNSFRLELRKLLIQTVMLTGLFVVFSLLVIEPLLTLLNKPLYLQQLQLFPWILLAMTLYCLGMVPHYALYSQGKDKPIIYSHIASLVIFVPATFVFSQWNGFLAVPLGLCAAFTLILLWKTLAFYRLTPRHYRSSFKLDKF